MNAKLYKDILDYVPSDEREAKDREVMLQFIAHNEDVLLRDNVIAHITVSAWIVNETRDKVLMIYHNIYNDWAWVGGHADGDADLIHVAKKEIEEETGLTNVRLLSDSIYALNIVNVYNHIKRGNVVNSHLHLDIEYLFEASESDKIRIKEDENKDIRWIPIEEVSVYCADDNMRPIYIRLCDKINNYKDR